MSDTCDTGNNKIAVKDRTISAFAPGRCELAGNHVDHQGGIVLAATIEQGIRAEATLNDTGVISIYSQGFPPVSIDIADISPDAKPENSEFGTSAALVRGIAVAMVRMGACIGGMAAHLKSNLPPGGGLSSSAAFELIIAELINAGYNSCRFGPLSLAKAAQIAESEFFGKACGLMDQLAIASGGISLIDFANLDTPSVEQIPFDFKQVGFEVLLVDTHADHSLHTREFSQIPEDMWDVAHFFGKDILSQVDEGLFFTELPSLRDKLGDVATLRAIHYFREVRLVYARASALREGNMADYLHLTSLSAASSAQYLQNISFSPTSQPAAVTLAVVDEVLDRCATAGDIRGVCRIHGGGFGGSIQVYLPLHQRMQFVSCIEDILGCGSVCSLSFSCRAAHAKMP